MLSDIFFVSNMRKAEVFHSKALVDRKNRTSSKCVIFVCRTEQCCNPRASGFK